MQPSPLDLGDLRRQIIGVDSTFTTPFGERMLVYCDYTASGRCLHFVEQYLMGLQRRYANTHTEDDITGRSMTQLLHDAERSIKERLNAGPSGRIIACGTGATAAIDKLQQIVGVAVSPATRRALQGMLEEWAGPEKVAEFERYRVERQPVVFVGPYEHHSNEISWRSGLATVAEVRLAADGGVDLEHLRELLSDPRYEGRPKIGSFSAASNVTGMQTDCHEIARILHRHGALACFDFAASGPYVSIDMNPPLDADGGDPRLDAVFLSPHKFLGGPGSSGILVFHERIYPRDLGPSVAGGGTVDYVGPIDHDFTARIEEREKPGTPGVLQILKAALALEVKAGVGTERIEARERELVARAFERWQRNPAIEILGNPDPDRRVGIVSFNVRDQEGSYLHPKLVTSLLNDLFGIQSRAGCSCAGPYGHRLLDIDLDTSERYRAWIRKGYHGIKPGWCRVGFHYVMDDLEADYVIDAIDLLARIGYRLLPLYRFDLQTGSWFHRDDRPLDEGFGLDVALRSEGCEPTARPPEERQVLYAHYLAEAERVAGELGECPLAPGTRLQGELGDLQFFRLPAEDSSAREAP